MRFAIVDKATGRVENVIVLDEPRGFEVAEGKRLVPATDDAEPGGTLKGARFIRRAP